MFRNVLTITLRNLQRQFLYSFINIFGLAVGMACSLVIFLFVYGEWSHDRHIPNGDRIYRIGISFFNMGEFAIGSELIGEYLPQEFEGVAAFTRFENNPSETFSIGSQTFTETVFHADSSFFKVFSRESLSGDLASALDRPHSIVLTESMAYKFFNSLNVLGKSIEVGKEKAPHQVTAVVKDDHRNSHLKAKIWTSFSLDPNEKYVWSTASLYNYVLLHESFTKADLQKAIDQIVAHDIFPVANLGHKNIDDYLADSRSIKLHVTALHDIYLRSKVNFELTPGGNETNMIIFSIIAAFIVVLAAVNFINLSTARATRRAKEVGIRKSLGTSRGKLVLQFLFESVLISFIALIVALGLAELFTFTFFWITGQTLTIELWSPTAMIIVIGLAFLLGIAAGLYPAFYLTQFKPVKVLKGNFAGAGSGGFRSGLVVFQFAISICLIISTTVILSQFRFMETKDLGFDQENVLTIANMQMMPSPFSFRNELLNHPDVISASMHAGEPGSKNVISYSAFQTDEMEQPLSMFTYFGDENLQKVMGFRLIEGRWFDASRASDSAAVILNEAAVRALGIKGKVIGTQLNKQVTVIGIVSDFHWETLRNDIGPVAFQYENEKPRRIYPLSQLGIKVRASKIAAVLELCRTKWKQRVPGEVMQFQFLDENFGALMIKEAVFGKAIGFFTVLAIFISCLGLFGLSAYTAEQRTKEIGIRKALGATVSTIILMLNKQFTVLVFIAMFIAIPVSYFGIRQWLDQFAYKIELEMWMYLAGGVAALVICLLTVAFHSFKASRTNPAETLKCD